MDTPPPELEIEAIKEPKPETPVNKKPPLAKTQSASKDGEDAKIAMRRTLFAIRRESTIGTMVMAEKLDDNDIRRKFRNYEI